MTEDRQWRIENWDKPISATFKEKIERIDERIASRNKRLDAVKWSLTGLLLGLAIGYLLFN